MKLIDQRLSSPVERPAMSVRKRRAFTLIELFVVIAIISILVAILMPAVNSVVKQGKKTRAKADAKSVVAAWKAYYNEYGKWPVSSAGVFLTGTAYTPNATEGICNGMVTTTLVVRLLAPDVKRSLAGDDYLFRNYNQKSEVFLTYSRNSMDASHSMVDPWGNCYRFLFDVNKDGRVSRTVGGQPTNVFDSVIAWSLGPDANIADSTVDALQDNINSWE